MNGAVVLEIIDTLYKRVRQRPDAPIAAVRERGNAVQSGPEGSGRISVADYAMGGARARRFSEARTERREADGSSEWVCWGDVEAGALTGTGSVMPAKARQTAQASGECSASWW
jgi:hypothetical protein